MPWALFTTLFNLFDQKSSSSQQTLLWTFFPFGILVVALQAVSLTILHRGAWFKECLRASARHHASQFKPGQNRWKQIFLIGESTSNDTAITSNEASTKKFSGDEESLLLPPRSLGPVMKDCWLPVFSCCLLLLVSLSIYPSIAPYGFHQTYTWTTIINGLSLIAHTIVRFLPVYIKSIHIGQYWLLGLIVARLCVFFPLFLTVYKLKDIPVLHNPWFLSVCIMIFGGLHGYACTLTDIYAVNSVTHPQEVATVSKILVLLQLVSCGIAQFTGMALKSIR